MANELRVRIYIDYEKTAHPTVRESIDFYRSISGGQVHATEQTVGFAAEEALLIGDFTVTGCFCRVTNLDATNYVELRRATGEGAGHKIWPGCSEVFFFGSAAPFIIANTAAVQVALLIIEA